MQPVLSTLLLSLSLQSWGVKELEADQPPLVSESDNELTLFFFPSPYGINWESPTSVTRSSVANRITFKDRNIGHVAIEIKCRSKTPEENFHYLTGMTGDTSMSKKLLFQGLGMGILFYNFPGSIEPSQKLKDEILEKIESNRVNFVKFKINKNSCVRVANYLNEFVEKGMDVNYGLPNRPLFGEGSGCSAFGASFLELTGLINDEFKTAWSKTINVPNNLIGTPIQEQKVSLTNLLFSDLKWATENEPHTKISFWDPDAMFNWVNLKVKNFKATDDFVITKVKNTHGLIYDKRHIDTPPHDIWKK